MYKIGKVIDDELLYELLEDFKGNHVPTNPSGVSHGIGKNEVDTMSRRSTRVETHYSFWPEICDQLEQFVGDGSRVGQMDFVVYNEGDFFSKHYDAPPPGQDYDTEPSIVTRKWTTVTLLELSDDYRGQGLCLYDGNDEKVSPSFTVGETIAFRSYIFHEAQPVEQGSRLVLVSWLLH